MPIGIKFVKVTLHYIQSGTKSGQDSEFGTTQCPGRADNFPGTGRQNWGLSGKIGMDGHLTLIIL